MDKKEFGGRPLAFMAKEGSLFLALAAAILAASLGFAQTNLGASTGRKQFVKKLVAAAEERTHHEGPTPTASVLPGLFSKS